MRAIGRPVVGAGAKSTEWRSRWPVRSLSAGAKEYGVEIEALGPRKHRPHRSCGHGTRRGSGGARPVCGSCAEGDYPMIPTFPTSQRASEACWACAVEQKQRAAAAEVAAVRGEPVRVTIDLCPVHSVPAEETKPDCFGCVERQKRLDATTHAPCHAEIERLLARVTAAEERIDQMAGVPCVREWGKRPMKCLPNDQCSFCRARTFMADLRGEGDRK
jgi:hypothetical protein